MAGARANHSGWRELIAARLDRPLTRVETRSLAAHLRDCAACREADRDYREQRGLLRAIPQRPAPRDLWPRTSAALDREVARGSYRSRRESGAGRRSAPSTALVTSIAALGLVAALGVMQLLPAMAPPPARAPGPATPFAIAPQPLAFVGSDAAGLYVNQTHVGHACPQNAPDCSVDEGIIRTPVNLPASLHARNVALSPSGTSLALVGHDLNHDVIAVVMLPPGAGDGATDPGSQTPDANQPTGDPDATPVSPGASDESGPPTDPPDDSRVVAILENIEITGAQPAWSPSGAMLAFSAMPADGSHGPDIYVWAPSDSVARPITSDHGSYFASWSAERIVLSRVAPKAGSDVAPLRTLVIDPSTSEERAVNGPPLWLPAVNPAGSHAVAWVGQIDLATGLAVLRSGALFMTDWAAIDPFRPGNEPQPTAVAPETPAVTDAPPTDAPTAEPATPPASASGSPSPSATVVPPTASASATPKHPASDGPPTPHATATPQQLPGSWVELDLGRDVSTAPVDDWQARWSLDGQVLGIWIADTMGSTWGRLSVLAIDPATDLVQTADPLLSPTLARRGFSLGMSRVAWVAPSEDNPDGELRIRTWGDDGVGGLRVQPFKLEEVVPAF